MAGNWKMYKTASQTAAFFETFKPLVAGSAQTDIVICPPSINLSVAVDATRDTNVEVGGQNLHWAAEGAYTGEISAAMLQAAGAKWVLIGHSERRQYFGETDEFVFKKAVAALSAGLKPIVCVGEMLDQRESGATEDVLRAQFLGAIAPLAPDQLAQLAIAYEPVWAIGTGRTATPQMADDAHRFLRSQVRATFGDYAADSIRILYGGSVKPDNVKTLMAQAEIDGVLVGGASLDPKGFAEIVNFD